MVKWYYWNSSAWTSGGTYQSTGYADGSITVEKTNFQPISNGVLGANLFNKAKSEIGGLDPATGNNVTNANYVRSEYIAVTAGNNYSVSEVNQMVFYDSSKVFVNSGVVNSFPSKKNYTFTVPTGASFVRFNAGIALKDSLMFNAGNTILPFEPYGYVLRDKSVGSNQLKDKGVKSANVDDNAILLSHIGFPIAPFSPSKNLFNKNDVTSDYYVSWTNGTLASSTSYVASNYIKIDPNTAYTINNFDQIAWFDSNKVYISGVDGYQLATMTVTSPVNGAYIRVSVRKTKLDVYQLEKGSATTTYETYGNYISENMLTQDLKTKAAFQTVQSVMNVLVQSSKKINIKLLGDSITHGVGGTGYAQDGALIYDPGWTNWHVNTSGHCWANSLKSYFESKFNCSVKNYGMSGAGSANIVEGINAGALLASDDDIVILMIGTNDRNVATSAGSPTNFLANLNTIINLVRGQGKKIILMSNIPASIANETGTSPSKNFHMEDVDHIIMKAAASNGMEYISLYKRFIDYCEARSITMDSLLNDGLHPNDAGYDVMFYLISNALGYGTKRTGATW
jgi:lysophospholipase L1-like esterase